MNFNKIENFLIFTEPILNKNELALFYFVITQTFIKNILIIYLALFP